jgi:hypothetical protein
MSFTDARHALYCGDTYDDMFYGDQEDAPVCEKCGCIMVEEEPGVFDCYNENCPGNEDE